MPCLDHNKKGNAKGYSTVDFEGTTTTLHRKVYREAKLKEQGGRCALTGYTISAAEAADWVVCKRKELHGEYAKA